MKKIFLIISFLAMSLAGKAQVSNYQNWMSQLDDNAFICQLSIPGAHDACSSSFSGWSAIGGAIAGKTQSKSISDMLPQGVRLFDLRPNNKLNIYHGILQTSSTFNGVMGQLKDYVSNHPTEFCIVLIRHESEGDSGDDSFADNMKNALASFSDYLVPFRPNLTVGEARGKILFLSRDDYNGPMYGGKVTGWRDNQSEINNMLGAKCNGAESWKCPLWSQGYYEYSSVDAKKAVIEAMLNKSRQLAGKYDYTWVINSLDGYPSDATYTNSTVQNNAKACNPYLQGLLSSGNYNGPVGFVFMDYCCDGDGSGYYGLSLTKELINHNFRYTMSKQGDPIYDGSGNLYVAPKGCDMMWEAKVRRMDGTSLSGSTGWYKTDFNDSNWDTRRFPTANSGAGASYYSLWDETNNTLFIRREFNIDHDPTIDTYKLYVCHDDGFVAYLNGSQFQSENGWIGSYKEFSIPSSILKVGRNVLAIRQEQGDGGAYFDCGVLRIEGTKHTVSLGADWQSYVAPGHNFDFSSIAVKAYRVTEVNGTSAHLEEVTSVPADEAVVVRPDNGAGTYNIPVKQSPVTIGENLLKATTSPLTVTAENTIYCIAKKNGKTGFYPVAVGVTVPKGKGYLDLSDSQVKPAGIFLDDEDPTNIKDMKDLKDSKDIIYNVAGQRLSKPQPGLNIKDGKKVLY